MATQSFSPPSGGGAPNAPFSAGHSATVGALTQANTADANSDARPGELVDVSASILSLCPSARPSWQPTAASNAAAALRCALPNPSGQPPPLSRAAKNLFSSGASDTSSSSEEESDPAHRPPATKKQRLAGESPLAPSAPSASYTPALRQASRDEREAGALDTPSAEPRVLLAQPRPFPPAGPLPSAASAGRASAAPLAAASAPATVAHCRLVHLPDRPSGAAAISPSASLSDSLSFPAPLTPLTQLSGTQAQSALLPSSTGHSPLPLPTAGERTAPTASPAPAYSPAIPASGWVHPAANRVAPPVPAPLAGSSFRSSSSSFSSSSAPAAAAASAAARRALGVAAPPAPLGGPAFSSLAAIRASPARSRHLLLAAVIDHTSAKETKQQDWQAKYVVMDSSRAEPLDVMVFERPPTGEGDSAFPPVVSAGDVLAVLTHALYNPAWNSVTAFRGSSFALLRRGGGGAMEMYWSTQPRLALHPGTLSAADALHTWAEGHMRSTSVYRYGVKPLGALHSEEFVDVTACVASLEPLLLWDGSGERGSRLAGVAVTPWAPSNPEPVLHGAVYALKEDMPFPPGVVELGAWVRIRNAKLAGAIIYRTGSGILRLPPTCCDLLQMTAPLMVRQSSQPGGGAAGAWAPSTGAAGVGAWGSSAAPFTARSVALGSGAAAASTSAPAAVAAAAPAGNPPLRTPAVAVVAAPAPLRLAPRPPFHLALELTTVEAAVRLASESPAPRLFRVKCRVADVWLLPGATGELPRECSFFLEDDSAGLVAAVCQGDLDTLLGPLRSRGPGAPQPWALAERCKSLVQSGSPMEVCLKSYRPELSAPALLPGVGAQGPRFRMCETELLLVLPEVGSPPPQGHHRGHGPQPGQL